MQNDWKYTKNSKVITIPEGTTFIPNEAFLDCELLEEVIIPDSVMQIGVVAFKGCKSLKKVKLPTNLEILEDFAFSECSSLDEVDIPESLHYFAYGVFSHCTNLKKVNSHNDINYINDLAFYNCKKLEFSLPTKITSIGRMAFMGCESIKEIIIPKDVDCIEVGAFAFMSSLEKIIVDEQNTRYMSLEDDTVLLSKEGIVLQYAINCDKEEFIAGYYEETLGSDPNGNQLVTNALIYNIADYAFAGAKKLKKIHFPSELESIGENTFSKCDNLKELRIFHTPYGDTFLLNIYNSSNAEIDFPFETIVIDEGVKTLCENLSLLFKNATDITLPQTLEHISGNVFRKSSKLESLDIPENIKMIMPNTFYPELEINLPMLGRMKAKDFNMLQTKTNNNYDIDYNNKDNITVFALTNGTYYVKLNEFDLVKVTKDEIASFSNDFPLENEPDLFVSYMIDLLSINAESNYLLTQVWTNQELQQVFHKFVCDLEYAEAIASKKVAKVIREIMKQSHPNIEFIFSSLLMKKISKEDLIKILQNYNESLVKLLKINKIDTKINVDKLIAYCNLLEKYGRNDIFFFNPILFQKLSYENQELLIKNCNKDIKHLLNNSKTLYDVYGVNLNDLMNLCNALGVFSEDAIISQRITTFINEKILNKESENSVTGNNIHTVFGEIKPREEIDYEFIDFFIKNYDKLIQLDRNFSGSIARIYNSFRDISRTSTSHKGSQRHLKVTINKCLDYFSAKKFEGITDKNRKLARLLHQFYCEPYVLKISEQILKESQKAPRNIFAPFVIDKNNKMTFDNDSQYDLKEETDDNYTYEWLPKQDYNNFVLGKYCSCCAHVLGAGAGIMRASMILDNCQNLVIRNKGKQIIAKMTIFVNREAGYAVFNTTEVNTNYHTDEALHGIYEAFMRGTKAFVEEYNKNNLVPISIVTIGEYRNVIKDKLGNQETFLYPTPNYSDYGYDVEGEFVGNYKGDSKVKQLLVLNKQKETC